MDTVKSGSGINSKPPVPLGSFPFGTKSSYGEDYQSRSSGNLRCGSSDRYASNPLLRGAYSGDQSLTFTRSPVIRYLFDSEKCAVNL